MEHEMEYLLYEHRERLPATVLLAIRDHNANDWKSLCKEFNLNHQQYHTGHYRLHDVLMQLRDAGIISFSLYETDKRGTAGIKGKIEISPQWEKIQTSLGISLVQLAEFEPTKKMSVKPLFGLPVSPIARADIFVLMPFSQDLEPVYRDHITKVAQLLYQKIVRADDFFTTQSIMADIWNAICDSRLIIADCTSRNPNVFYEIGLAHTIGKRVILITQNKDDVPFDLRHLRFIHYEYTPRGMTEFEKRLTETIKQELVIRDVLS